MANNYCENKSNKPVITRYDPSKNYMVQMVESLASIDYPNENHIYVIESTGEKYIFYNGAFSKLESANTASLKITVTANNVVHTGHNYYSVDSSSDVTFSKTYTEIYNALRNGAPMVVTYNGLTKECIALQIDSSTIELSVCDAFLDTVPKPRYRTETFTIKSDNTGSYVKTLLSMNGLDTLIGNQ